MAEAVAIAARRGDLERRVEEIRFLVFGRSLPAMLFALLGWRVLLNLLSQVRALPVHAGLGDIVAGPLTTCVYLLFCVIPVGIYLVRPRPRARDGRLVARTAGLVGTTMLLVVGAFPNPVLLIPPAAIRGIAAVLALGAFALGVYGLLYLRRSLSIIPEARRLVTGGPYRLIRHPLYAAEILAACALVMARPGMWATLMLVPFIAVQMLRARFEEGLLTRIFPEYKRYAGRTRRLIPLVW
jgi:protein-S-isoprenylcysteine O-methyltransferase Ste14